MDTKQAISKLNVLFNDRPDSPYLDTIIRFPIRFMTSEEIDSVSEFLTIGNFYIGYIDFTQDTSQINNDVVVTDSLQKAMYLMIGKVPFFDAILN